MVLDIQAAGVDLRLADTGGYGIVRLAAEGAEVFAQGEGPGALWRVTLRSPGGKEVVLDNRRACRATHRWEATPTGRRLVLEWRGLRVGEKLGTAAVKVTIEERRGSEWLLAWIEVEPGGRTGVWEVQFPRIERLAAGQGDYTVAPAGWGKAIRAGGRPWQDTYPGHWCSMQMQVAVAGGSSLCVAALDPEAWTKRLGLTPERGGVTSFFTHYPEGMGEVGRVFRLPYPMALAAGRGDWYEAARRYRGWAERQKWASGRPPAARPEVSAPFRELTAWARLHDAASAVLPHAKQFTDYFGGHTAVHWYVWHEIPFDDTYPEYFPPKPGFREGVAAVRRAGMLVMPYINGRLWDTKAGSWLAEDAARSAVKRPNGEVVVETYGSGKPLAVMCPTTRQWQDKVAGIVRELVGTWGVDGVYIDQIGAAPPVPCFDPEHGHPLGGGHHWVSAYRDLVGAISREVKAADGTHFLTTESNGEPFLDLFDGVLMCNSTEGDLVPLFPAVYGGKVLTFGSYLFPQDVAQPHAFYMKTGQEFVFGAQVGWLQEFILTPETEPHRRYLRDLAALRGRLLPWLAYGEMLPPPVSAGAMPELTDEWLVWGQMTPVTLPAVQAGAWRAADGTVAVVFANAGAEEQRYELAIDRGRWGLPAGVLEARWVRPGGEEQWQAVAGEKMRFALGGREARAVVVRGVTGESGG